MASEQFSVIWNLRAQNRIIPPKPQTVTVLPQFRAIISTQRLTSIPQLFKIR